MLLTLDDQILNLNHVSRVSIKSYGEAHFKVIAEYAPQMYIPRTEYEGSSLKEFIVELYQGSKEECQGFIRNLAVVWQSTKRNIVTVKEIRDSVGKF